MLEEYRLAHHQVKGTAFGTLLQESGDLGPDFASGQQEFYAKDKMSTLEESS